MPSFDVVSEVDEQEVRNAIDQTRRELSTRWFQYSTFAPLLIPLNNQILGRERRRCRNDGNQGRARKPGHTCIHF